ncbi:carboxymuconolactone decarboxylase family protein [Dasania marina]|uniref:carboxymuconolactone decarboxylase family protein n=1 Tax=Dasania marina TaxID=471499 RepID=UPI0030D89F50|tara:strand:+ start:12748 stop:13335 length:588 start_codon:yes stop_codon:yes gene_type:complete
MTDKLCVKPLAIDEWDESITDIKQDMNGHPINVHSLMAHHPELLKSWWSFRNYSVKGGELGKRKGELVILRVAVHMKAWYEWGSHVERSLACGLTRQEIERVKQGGKAPGWEISEALLLNAIDELITNHGLSSKSHAQLRDHFSIKQIMDIIAIHGMYVILGCMINTWGLELDTHVAEKLPSDVTQEHFEAEFPR